MDPETTATIEAPTTPEVVETPAAPTSLAAAFTAAQTRSKAKAAPAPAAAPEPAPAAKATPAPAVPAAKAAPKADPLDDVPDDLSCALPPTDPADRTRPWAPNLAEPAPARGRHAAGLPKIESARAQTETGRETGVRPRKRRR